MKKYLLLYVALVAALEVVWAFSLKDILMAVLLIVTIIYCIYAQFVLLKK